MIGPEALPSFSHVGALAVAAIPFATILLKMPPGSIITKGRPIPLRYASY